MLNEWLQITTATNPPVIRAACHVVTIVVDTDLVDRRRVLYNIFESQPHVCIQCEQEVQAATNDIS